jgi:ABC-type transport system involved in cytochrome bd biosynthesis fused ATPase/permease subunit
MAPSGGGWLAPLLALVAVRRIVEAIGMRADRSLPAPGPPGREVRGSLELRDAVLGGKDGAIRSVPVQLTLAAGESVAVLCDDPSDAAMLAETLACRRPLVEGSLLMDGQPAVDGTRLVAVIGPGETFVVGSVEENLAALTGGVLGRGELAAIEEACSMDEVRREGAGQTLAADGAPLSVFHRLLILAARVIPSHYRLVVVVDPAPWVNLVRAEVWRAAVVRASVGRTAVWLTADRSLATRADRALAWRHGNLAPAEGRRGDEA